MSLSRTMRRQFERKTRKKEMSELYRYADNIQNRIDVRDSAKEADRTMYSFSCVLAMCCRVLVNEFHWGKLPKTDEEADSYYRLVRFCKAVEAEANSLTGTKTIDLESYCEKVYEEIGVKFVYE